MKIGKSVLNKSLNGVTPPKRQERKQTEKLEQTRKKKTDDTEENIKYSMPCDEGDASAKDLQKQSEELAREKHNFDARHDVKLDNTEEDTE